MTNCAPSWTVKSWASSHARPGYDCSKTSGSSQKSSKTRRLAANASKSSWVTNLYRLPGRTPACSFLTQASSSIRLLPGPARLYARNLATLLVGFLDTPNGGPGVETDQFAALDNNAPVANPKQYPVGVGRRAVCVAHPDALSNPGLGYSLLRHPLRHRLRHRRLPAWPPATTTA